MAERQLEDFQRTVEAVNQKLQAVVGLLPGEFFLWWVSRWVFGFEDKTRRLSDTPADMWAMTRLCRRADRELRLSDPVRSLAAWDVVFTYYDGPLVRGGDTYNPFATWAFQDELRGHRTPTHFPRCPPPDHYLRMCSEQFLEWGGFLAGASPLTEAQIEEIAHVGISDREPEDFSQPDPGEHPSHGLRESLKRWLRESATRFADANNLAPPQNLWDRPFRDVIDGFAGWLEAVEFKTANSPPDISTVGVRSSLPKEVIPRCGRQLFHLPDWSVVYVGGEPFHLSSEPRQAVVKLLVERWEAGSGEVRKEELLGVANTTQTELREVFRSGSPKVTATAWIGVVLLCTHSDGREKRGWYRLNISDPGAVSRTDGVRDTAP